MGGSEAIIAALIRGLEKNGGRLLLRSHVDHIVMEGGRATGVALRRRSPAPTPNGSSSSSSEGPLEVIRARKGVVSNASVWDTHKLLAPGVGPKEWRRESVTTPQVRRCYFMCYFFEVWLLFASSWDTHKLLVPGVGPKEWRRESVTTPQVRHCYFLCYFDSVTLYVILKVWLLVVPLRGAHTSCWLLGLDLRNGSGNR